MSIENIVGGIKESLEAGSEIDYISSIEWLTVLGRFFSLAIDILSFVIMLLIPIVVSLECTYIAIPLFRASANKAIQAIYQRGYSHNPVEFALSDAIKAINKAEVAGEGSAMYEYLKIKFPSVLFEMFLLFFVTNGGSVTMLNFVKKIFSGIMDGIFGITI